MSDAINTQPDERGHWGRYGGRFVPETLMAPLEALTGAYNAAREDASFRAEFESLLRDYSGRPTPLFYAARLTESAGGARIFLKREDLSHTGSHKINNALKAQGVPVRMLVLPRQPHGPTEPKMLLEVMRANLEWFDKWIGGK